MSSLEFLKPVYSLLPEVASPEKKGSLTQRLTWTLAVLLIFFIMGNITIIGLDSARLGELQRAQIILAASVGTLVTVGIGPIVLASIILQLLVGGGLIKVDFSDPEQKKQFSGTQKLLAIVLAFLEGTIYTVAGFLTPLPGLAWLVILQVALGAILVIYLDEVVSKYGVGSGVGLFIAAGVAIEIIWRVFNPLNVTGEFAGLNGSGLLFVFFNEVTSNIGNTFILALMPILMTVIVFFVVVYAEGMHVNIPITLGRKGTGGRYPIKFLYVSNMPVILASALFINISIWAELTKSIPFIGQFFRGLAVVTTPQHSLLEQVFLEGISPTLGAQIIESITRLQFIGLGGSILQAMLYVVLLVIVCIVFGRLWIEVGGQGPEKIAEQLERAGMSIPGFRRDPRVIRQVLDRYVPTITILGSAFVGLLAGIADITGAIGSGTGILLTVGIIYRIYEEIAKTQIAETNPLLRGFLGQGGGF